MSELTDTELVARCRKGNDDAWRELVKRYASRVFAIAYGLTGRPEEAEELTQDVFLKLWTRLDRYDGSLPLLPWILRLSRNLVIDHLRSRSEERRRVHVDTEELDRHAGNERPDADFEQRERSQRLLDAISGLPPELAEVIVLRDLNGLSYTEIAAAVDLPEGTVKSRLNRGRIELAERLRPQPLEAGRSGESVFWTVN